MHFVQFPYFKHFIYTNFTNTQQCGHYTYDRAISCHHPWMRVARCNINTHEHSRKRPAPPKRNSRRRHTFSPRRRKRRGYFLSYAAPAVYSPSVLRIFHQVTCPDASLTFFTHYKKSVQRR